MIAVYKKIYNFAKKNIANILMMYSQHQLNL